MVLARWQASIVDSNGNVIPSASVEVRSEATGNLATLYSDRAGSVGISNPITADSNGFAAFHVTGGAYQIVATSGSFSRTWRYVPIGTAGEADKGLVTIASGVLSNSPFVAVNGLDSYSEIEIILRRVVPSTDNTDLLAVVSTDSGYTYLGGTLNLFTLNRATSSTAALTGATGTSALYLAQGLGNNTGEFYTGKLSLINHRDTSVYKGVQSSGVQYDQAAAQRVAKMDGIVKTGGIITNIAFLMSTGNINMDITVKGVP